MYLNKGNLLNAVFLCLEVIFVVCPALLRAEGTKELEPTTTSYSKFQAGDDKAKNYAVYSSPKEKKLYIHIEDPSAELIYYGFGYTFSDNDKKVAAPCLYRIKDPNGNIVVLESPVPGSGNGYINSRSEALIGPNGLNGAVGGYIPLSYKPTIAGDYYIEFKFISAKVRFDFIDITVAKNNEALKGRLWSYVWSLCTLDQSNPSNSKFYIYSDDSVVTSLDLNGMQPFGFSVMCNRLGTNVSSDFTQSRKSIHDPNGQYSDPQFKIFLNDPDNIAYPSFKKSTTINGVKINNCLQGNSCQGLTLDVSNEGLAEIYLDLDSNTIYSANSSDVLITKFLYKGTNCITWDGKDGFGKKLKLGTIVRVYTSLLSGLTNFPINDPEYSTYGIKVALVRPNINSPAPPDPIPLSWDDSGPQVGGTTSMNCTGNCHTWSYNVGNDNTINTWWHIYNVKKIDSILFIPWPEAYAGKDLLICSNELNSVKLGSPSQFSEDVFSWTELSGKPLNGDNSLAQPVFDVQSNTAEILNFQLTVSRRGCLAMDNVNVIIHPPINRNIQGRDIVCTGEKRIEYALDDPIGLSYTWVIKGGKSSDDVTNQNKLLVDWNENPVSNSGVSVVIIDYPDCLADSAKLAVKINPILKTGIPRGDSIVCSNNVSKHIYEVIPSQPNSGFDWELDPTYGTIISDPSNSFIAVHWNNDGLGEKQTYIKVKEIFTQGTNSCSDNKFSVINIKFSPKVSVDAGEDFTVCSGNEKNIVAEVMESGNTYQWTPSSNLLDPQNSQTVFKTSMNRRIHLKYTLTKTRALDGCIGNDSVFVNLIPTPDTRLPYHILKVCNETEGDKEVEPLNIGNNTITWKNVNSSGNSFIVDESFFSDASHHVVYMMAESPEQCISMDSILIEDNCASRVFVPKAFTPNGDGNNDVVKIFGLNFTDFEMTIFSRWGEIIFETKDRNQTWDGTYLGEPSPAGTYIVTLSYLDKDRKIRRARGTVTLIR